MAILRNYLIPARKAGNTMKFLIATFAIALICFHTQAQSRLKMTKSKTIKFENGKWDEWPDDYNYFESDAGPVLEIASIDGGRRGRAGTFKKHCPKALGVLVFAD